jgi:hypothetical protein
VEEVDVDVVAAEAAQARLAGLDRVAAGAALLVCPLTGGNAELRRDDGLVAALLQRGPEELL